MPIFMNEKSIREERIKYFQEAALILNEGKLETNATLLELQKHFREAERYFSTRNEFYKIAICGAFQRGKSTTINAIAGGREISAISSVKGIPTSTSNVYFYGGDKNECKFDLISDEEICEMISRFMKINLNGIDLWKWETRKLLLEKLKEHFQDESANDGLEEIAMILSGIGFLPALRKKFINDVKLSNITKFAMAPQDERVRWGKIRQLMNKNMSDDDFKNLIQNEFPTQECIYPFIKNIFVQINSQWLNESNFCIIDTPGLEAKKFDTEMAIEAIKDSDAVTYIFNGNCELTESERKFLYEFREIIVERPHIFAINSYGQNKIAVSNSIKVFLMECGFDESSIVSYNALLAYRAEQGENLLNNQLESTFRKKIINEAKNLGSEFESSKEAWSTIVASELFKVSKKAAIFVNQNGLCPESINLLKDVSHWEDFLNTFKKKFGGQDFELLFEKQIKTPLDSYFMFLSNKVDESKKKLIEIIESDLKKNDDEWLAHKSRLGVISISKQNSFESRINLKWFKFLSEEIWKSFEKRAYKIARLIERLCVEPEKFDFNTEIIRVINESMKDWRDKFIKAEEGTSSNILFECGKKFEEIETDDEVVEEIWLRVFQEKKTLRSTIIDDLNERLRPFYTKENFSEKYITSLIKEGFNSGISSKALKKYFSAKTSWNPFINKEERMKEARDELFTIIKSRIYSTIVNIREEAVTAIMSDEEGEASHLYKMANIWVMEIIFFANGFGGELKKLEKKKYIESHRNEILLIDYYEQKLKNLYIYIYRDNK